MSRVSQHYDKILDYVYSWMLGEFEFGIYKNYEFFKHYNININPTDLSTAVDLGAGYGFQSRPRVAAN